jgi:hypothetical protein
MQRECNVMSATSDVVTSCHASEKAWETVNQLALALPMTSMGSPRQRCLHYTLACLLQQQELCVYPSGMKYSWTSAPCSVCSGSTQVMRSVTLT